MKALLIALLTVLQTEPSSIIKCTGSWDTQGCRSFQQMADHKDKDVITLINSPYHAFVCFPPGVDKFVLVNFNNPTVADFKKHPQYEAWQAFGVVMLTTFKNGIEDDDQLAIGQWTSYDKNALPAASFSSAEKSEVTATITDSEVSVSFSFTNVSGGKSTRAVQIRRSTLRYQDSLQATIKDKGEDTPFTTAEKGYCAEFK